MKAEKSLFVLILVVFIAVAAVIIIRRPHADIEGENGYSTEETDTQYTEESETYYETETVAEETSDAEYVEEFVESIGGSGADSILLSMFPVATYNEEIFLTNVTEVTEILDVPLDSGKQLVEVLETILETPNTLSRVLLGIHTEGIKEEGAEPLVLPYQSDVLQEGYSWEASILEFSKLYPNIIFDIVFYYPKISQLTAMDQESVDGMMDWYAYVADLYYHYDAVQNICISMPGCEEWLICNESNYQDEYNLTPVIANEVEALVFCDHKHVIYQENFEEKCSRLLELINTYRDNPPVYRGQEEYTYVFLGDSVIGNYTDSLSIPGVVAYMTGAQAINCGFGGLSATKAPVGVQDVVDILLSKEADRDATVIGNPTAQSGILEFWEEALPEQTDKLVFFLSFGINDYMTGHPVYNEAMDETCYKGALTEAAEALQAAYPNAKIVLMTPNFIALGNYGEDTNGESGSRYVDYIEAVYELGAEKNLQIIDVYREAGITAENSEDYLADMCHPNYLGRFKIGEIIWKHMSALQS